MDGVDGVTVAPEIIIRIGRAAVRVAREVRAK